MKRLVLLSVLAGLLVGGGETAAADPLAPLDGPRGTSTAKSLVIGIDGASLRRIRAADTPVLDRLMREGTTSLTYRYAAARDGLEQQARPLRGPGWTTALTGGWPSLHLVVDDTFGEDNYIRFYPDYLTLAERRDPTLSTFSVTDWTPLGTSDEGGPVISDEIDRRVAFRSDADGPGYTANDRRSADLAARHLRRNGPDASFVYFGRPGEVGRTEGSASRAYAESLEVVDRHVGRLLTAIASRPSSDREQWQVIVTNSHGTTGEGRYGGSSLEEREQLLIARGPGIARGVRRDLFNATDIAPTVFDHLGVPRRGSFSGSPIGTVRDFRFGGGGARFGDGWRVDNSDMPAGGQEAWRGWQLTDQAEWSAAGRGVGRENFVDARGVLAVADTRAWRDAEEGEVEFDSTLVSPPYDVEGWKRRQIRFDDLYQHEATSEACVSVSFDGGPVEEQRCYASSGGSGASGVTVPIPHGAERMRVHFEYAGEDDWFWAIDDVRVCNPRAGVEACRAA